ncbi:MAG: acetolactate decarboxylase [Chitinophagales bacterium]
MSILKLGTYASLGAILFILSCTSSKSYNATTIGEEETLIKKGDMATHIALKDLQSKQHLFAIGSVTNLKGYIVIDDSRPFASFVQNGNVAIDSSWNTDATLLVYSQVDQWKEISIPDSVKTYGSLERFVLNSAKENKINPDVAFPFLLKGTALSISWRVSDWDPNDKEVTNKKVKSSGLKGVADSVKTSIVGFYCTKQYRVLAEHDTKMHLHFMSDNRLASGHIDDILLNGEMKLYLPEESNSK